MKLGLEVWHNNVDMYVGGRSFTCPRRSVNFYFSVYNYSSVLQISLQKPLNVIRKRWFILGAPFPVGRFIPKKLRAAGFALEILALEPFK
jgi:hypothetical protein